MDQATLVEIHKEGGQRLIERLAEEGIEVTAAAWLKASDDDRYYLNIATPIAEEGADLRPAYRRIHAVIRATPELSWIGAGIINVVSPESPIALGINEINGQFPRPAGFEFGAARFGKTNIERAYIYPRPAPALVGAK